jgi:hypothetical protein
MMLWMISLRSAIGDYIFTLCGGIGRFSTPSRGSALVGLSHPTGSRLRSPVRFCRHPERCSSLREKGAIRIATLHYSLSHGSAPNHMVLIIMTVVMQFEISRTGRTQPECLLCQAVALPIRTHVELALVQPLEFLFTLRVCTFGDTCVLHNVLSRLHSSQLTTCRTIHSVNLPVGNPFPVARFWTAHHIPVSLYRQLRKAGHRST